MQLAPAPTPATNSAPAATATGKTDEIARIDVADARPALLDETKKTFDQVGRLVPPSVALAKPLSNVPAAGQALVGSWTKGVRSGLPELRGASNILFSMCGFDGWGSAGMQQSPDPARMLVSLNVSDAGHHADLMFSTADDPPSFAAARSAEIGYVTAWIAEARAAAAAAREHKEL